MAEYALTLGGAVRRNADGATIPSDPRNMDYVAYLAWVARGNAPDAAPVAVPPRREVSKLAVVDRLIAAGKAATALGAMDAVSRMRWDACTSIYADDADVIGLLTAIGADVAVILAP